MNEAITEKPLPQLPVRAAESHKGDYGTVLLIGGSLSMSGAIILSATAALRSGAGLVTVAVPEKIQERVAAAQPCYMTVGLPDDAEGRCTYAALDKLFPFIEQADVVAVGPGLARSSQLTSLVINLYQNLKIPLVLDADALFALSEVDPAQWATHAGPRILTPHAGEFHRLNIQHRREQTMQESAISLAEEQQWVLLLKGHHTLITDGSLSIQNQTGNPGMATGGSGDVLTGIITALIGQGLSPFDAAQLGAHIHGMAGDLAAESVGEVSLIATDIIQYLPAAFQHLINDPKERSTHALAFENKPSPSD